MLSGYKSILGIVVLVGATAAYYFGYSDLGDFALQSAGSAILLSIGLVHKLVKYAALVQKALDAFAKVAEKLPKEQ